MRELRPLPIATVTAVILLMATLLDAQVTTATVYGVVRDTSMAVVPGALITVVNQGTALSREIVSDGNGEFALTALPTGRYTLKIELQGHTDSTGTPPYNLKLSQRRAESVRTYLLNKGVNGDQLVAKGYGQTQPVASNKTADGRSKNRRVVMYVVSNPGEVKVEGAGTTPESPSGSTPQ